MKFGIIQERKSPPDSRVPLTPDQCAKLSKESNIELVVESSPIRCYTDQEYRDAGVSVVEDISDCDVLMGVKEVPIDALIPDKTYFFFSHTIKKQVYNRPLLQAILEKNIHLLDYEVLTNDLGQRLIAFGKFAGMVGAHNGILTYGRRTGLYDLKRMKDCHDYAEAKRIYKEMKWPGMKIALTGGGRVASGAASVLDDMGIQQVSPQAFLNAESNTAVYTQLDCEEYATRKDGQPFDLSHFYKEPQLYRSSFAPYTLQSDIMINGIFWDNQAPVFFMPEDMADPAFKIKVIADVTCDIAPVASIPSTLRASTIADPIFGYDPIKKEEASPHQDGVIDMMTIDNLPNELPRDASQSFGEQFIQYIFGELATSRSSRIIERASVAKGGQLGSHFAYLQDYVAGKE